MSTPATEKLWLFPSSFWHELSDFFLNFGEDRLCHWERKLGRFVKYFEKYRADGLFSTLPATTRGSLLEIAEKLGRGVYKKPRFSRLLSLALRKFGAVSVGLVQTVPAAGGLVETTAASLRVAGPPAVRSQGGVAVGDEVIKSKGACIGTVQALGCGACGQLIHVYFSDTDVWEHLREDQVEPRRGLRGTRRQARRCLHAVMSSNAIFQLVRADDMGQRSVLEHQRIFARETGLEQKAASVRTKLAARCREVLALQREEKQVGKELATIPGEKKRLREEYQGYRKRQTR